MVINVTSYVAAQWYSKNHIKRATFSLAISATVRLELIVPQDADFKDYIISLSF